MNCKSSSSCSNNIAPQTSQYFKEELISKVLQIPSQKPDIERVLDVMVSASVENTKLIETPIGMSNEGQNLSGIKLVVEVRVKQKVLYVAEEDTQSVHASHFETLHSLFVILPNQVDGSDICNLFRANRLSINPFIETNTFRALDCRNIYSSLMIFLDVKIC